MPSQISHVQPPTVTKMASIDLRSMSLRYTVREPRPGKPDKVKAWRRRWYTGDPLHRRQLWAEYEYDFKRYFRAYQPNDEDFNYFQEMGMEAFVKLERKMQCQYRIQPYLLAGQSVVEILGAAITNGAHDVSPDVTFASIDFEGKPDREGVSEFGVASLDSRNLLSPSSPAIIETQSFAFKNHHRRRFMFGETVRLPSDQLASTVARSVNHLNGDQNARRIVLVCYGVQNELAILDLLGIALEDLPVIGVVDIVKLSRDVLRHTGTLEDLLKTLTIPSTYHSFHCAGNDAHFALQALLALLELQYRDFTGRLNELARRPVPSSPSWVKGEPENTDWDVYLDGGI